MQAEKGNGPFFSPPIMGLLCFFAPQYAEKIQEMMAEKERFPGPAYDEQHLELWESLLKRSTRSAGTVPADQP